MRRTLRESQLGNDQVVIQVILSFLGIPSLSSAGKVSPFFDRSPLRVFPSLSVVVNGVEMNTKLIFTAVALLFLCWFVDPAGASKDGRLNLLGDNTTGQIDPAYSWFSKDVKGIDDVNDVPAGFEGTDILTFYFDEKPDELAFRVSLVQMRDPATGEAYFAREKTLIVVLFDYADGGRSDLPGGLAGRASIAWEEAVFLNPFAGATNERVRCFYSGTEGSYNPTPRRASLNPRGEYVEGSLTLSPTYMNASAAAYRKIYNEKEFIADRRALRERIAAVDITPMYFEVLSLSGGKIVDRLLANSLDPTGETNCAFVHHGNQGLAYSDVFYGRYDDLDGSGFDEALQIHEALSIPGNFHLAATLQTSTEWDNNNGDPNDFNGWLAAGVSAGWCGMVTSAYAQHMMPFVQDAMNEWAVNVETQMTNTRYGYYPRVAWVPERVWLHPSFYPNAGVNDDITDDWIPYGVWAVILDDDVHCQGYDNHQIHTLSGSTLKVIPRDRNFTGKIVGGDGAGALQVLEDLANSGVGEYRFVLFAEDWEAVAEMGSWAGATPNAKETYDWFINKCSEESAWLHTWKVADAVSNPNFQGSTSMNVTYGTYLEIGGTAGYGGGNNGWYTDWAGYVPYANGGDGSGTCDPLRGGNCKNHGTLWNDAYTALMAAPDNNISQAGWYTLMTNLHETGWHDGMGGPISGWELNYSGHIKNTNMYAEASHWANDEYINTTEAYFSDIDNDGYVELVMHNDKVFAIFESIGARAVNVFAKGVDHEFSIIGVDNAYWPGTQADYNDVNHVGALSDVGPNYQHSLYDMEIKSGLGTVVEAVFTYQNLKKTVLLTEGESFFDVIYEVGPSTQYIKNGYSPGLVDLIWNAQMDRIWVGDAAYMGQRNPNNGATAALVLGGGGGNHNFDFSARIMKGDEIYGEGVFEFLLYAGKTSEPDSLSGEIAELRALATSLTDTLGPGVLSAVYYPGTDKLKINFNQITQYSTFSVTGVSIDDDDDGSAELTLASGTTVLETENSYSLTLQLTTADASALEGLNTTSLELMMAANTAYDPASNGNETITNEDNKAISYGAETSITIDGFIDTEEWDHCTLAVPDSNDSEWTSSNEIDGLYVTWDSLFLYIAIDAIVSNNSWLLYFDVDPGGPDGETDLTAIDAWERGTVFTASGFKCDFQYGCYQHQGPYDSDSFFDILSPTTTINLSDSIFSSFDSFHNNGDLGGSELAIPWHILYALGPGNVPANASISIVVSLCWDPEPDGVLGGDIAPNNISATLPTVDNAYTFIVDKSGNGKPDLPDKTPPELTECYRHFESDSLVRVVFSEPVDSVTAVNTINYTVFETAVPSNTVAVLSAEKIASHTVQLALEQPIGSGYSCSVSHVEDTSCYQNVIAPGSTIEIADGPTGFEIARPKEFSGKLYQNYPNPFNPSTTIRFEVPGILPAGGTSGSSHALSTAPVQLAVYDVTGRLVKRLVSKKLPPGPFTVVWNGTDDRGIHVSSGIYFCRIVSGNWSQTRKMVLLK